MGISDWSADVFSSDLGDRHFTRRDAHVGIGGNIGGYQLVVEDRAVRSDAFAMRQIFGELDRDRRIFEAEARRIAGSEEHTSELQSLMRISYDVFCLKKKT